jgi:hypothetical protein
MSETTSPPSAEPGAAVVSPWPNVTEVPDRDVDRARGFYERLGWRLDDDVAPLDGLRIVQFTPPATQG